MGALRFALRAVGVKKTFVLARGQQAALHAEFVHQSGKSKAIHQHANAAHDAGFVDINLIGGHRNIVGRRGARLFHHGVNGLFVFGFETANFVIHDARLTWAAAGRVDEQHHRFGALVFKGRSQRRHNGLGAGIAVVGDFTFELNHSCVRQIGVACTHAAFFYARPQHGHSQQQPSKAEKNAPATAVALLLQGGKSQALQSVALPHHFVAGRFRRLGFRVL